MARLQIGYRVAQAVLAQQVEERFVLCVEHIWVLDGHVAVRATGVLVVGDSGHFDAEASSDSGVHGMAFKKH